MIYRFGDFELDDGLFELRRDGRPERLPPKTFDLLLYLVRHRDRVVSKAELLDRLWPGEHVTEAVLPTNVRAARAALQDARGRSGLIQTVHGRGYRFVAPVEERLAAGESREGAVQEAPAFVGREEVMAELVADLDECFAGRGRAVLLAGEPGIGKTRTCEELALRARRRGARVLDGRAYEGEGVPAFWPWVHVLRGLVEGLTAAALDDVLGSAAPELARLVPELQERLPHLAQPPPLESETARFRFFDSATVTLRRASRAQPLLLVFDDLHWADEPTLRLLLFFAREIRDARVLLLGAYRDVELRRQHPLAPVLGELAREPHFRRVRLGGLSELDVAQFLEVTTGRPAPAGLARTVFSMTEGNPFFLGEMVRLLAIEGGLAVGNLEEASCVGLPEGIREAIGRRLDRLSPECNQLLTLAAVIGREFDGAVLARAAGQPARVLDLLDEAESARIVRSVRAADGGRALLPGRYAFGHALLRETLYEELTGPQRVRLHRSVAEALEALAGERSGAHLAELAYHFFQAAPGGDVERAVETSVRAGEQALALLAYEEAVAHFSRALQAAEWASPDEQRRCGLVLALARALWQAGRYPEGRSTFLQAAQLARELARPDLLAQAALGLGGWPQFQADEPPGGPADEYRALLEEALEGIPEQSKSLRARVLAGLAEHTDMETRHARSLEAVELARASCDPDAQFAALFARLVALLGPDDTRRRLETATELLELALRAGRRDRVFIAREARIRSLLMLGEIAKVDREIEACTALAEELRLPIHRHSVARFQLARALGDGRFDDATRLNREVLDLGRRSGDVVAELQFRLFDTWLRHLRGEPTPLEGAVEHLLARAGHLGPLPHALATFFYAELGREEAVRHHLERVAKRDFADVPRDEAWLVTVALSAGAASFLGDAPRMRVASRLLEPYADLLVAHQHMRIYMAPVSYVLARLAHGLGDRGAAVVRYEDAIERCRRIGARPFLAVALMGYTELLEAPAASPGERKRARALRAEAEELAAVLGMRRVASARRAGGTIPLG